MLFRNPQGSVSLRPEGEVNMAEQGGGGSSVNMVAIIAIVVLVALVAWFFMGQKSRQTTVSAPAGKAQTTEKKSDVQVDIDLPDSVTIKP